MTSLAVASLQTLASRIDSVTVYRRGALVRRVAALSLAEGELSGRVRIAGLPLAFEDGSLRVTLAAADGSPAVGLIATDAAVALEPPDADESPATLDEELKAARRAEAHVRAERDELERRASEIGRLAIPARAKPAKDEPPGPIPSAARRAFVDWQTRELEELDARRAEVAERLDEAERLRRSLEERANRVGSARPARRHELRKSVIVDLRRVGNEPSNAAELRIDYLTPGATWAAAYRAEFDRDLSHARLAFRALVRQATGEDWKQAAVTLSTAEPHSWKELPELASRRVGRRQFRPTSGWRAPPIGTQELFADFDRDARAISATIETPMSLGSTRAVALSGPPSSRKQYGSAPLTESDYDAGVTGTVTHPQGDRVIVNPDGTVMKFVRPLAAGSAPEFDRDARRTTQAGAAAPYHEVARGGGVPPPESPPPPMVALARALPPAPAGGAASGIVERSASASDAAKKRARSLDAVARPVAAPPASPRQEAAAAFHESAAAGLAATLYDYGRLEMPAFDDGQRGELRVHTLIDHYCEISVRLGWRSVRTEYVNEYHAAKQRAWEAEHAGLGEAAASDFERDGYDYAYATESRVDVPSDGRAHSVPVLSRAAAARPRYVCVPRESPQVFRLVELDNPLDLPLPPGPVDVVVAGEYLLTTRTPAVAARSPARFGLGVEQGIKVARNTSFREEAANFLGGSLDLVHEITVELANRLDRAVKVEVRERVPVKTEGDDAIAITVAPGEPAWKAYLPDDGSTLDGGYVWLVDAPAKKSVTLRGGYTIRIAAKNELLGGNRREG